MSAAITRKAMAMYRLLPYLLMAAALLLISAARAAAPGITGPVFNLTAQPAYISQPDGQSVYSWGYGCGGPPAGYPPSAHRGAVSQSHQGPGPHPILAEGP